MQDGMSQEEIDAILKGATAGANTEEDAPPAEEQVDASANLPPTGGATTAQGQLNAFQNVQEAQPVASSAGKSNINFLLDVPLNVAVELGRTKMAMRDMLQLHPGSVIELDKLIGEPVDLLVNEKLIAKGEVVVFDESFGVRITDIINPEDRIKSLR